MQTCAIGYPYCSLSLNLRWVGATRAGLRDCYLYVAHPAAQLGETTSSSHAPRGANNTKKACVSAFQQDFVSFVRYRLKQESTGAATDVPQVEVACRRHDWFLKNGLTGSTLTLYTNSTLACLRRTSPTHDTITSRSSGRQMTASTPLSMALARSSGLRNSSGRWTRKLCERESRGVEKLKTSLTQTQAGFEAVFRTRNSAKLKQ